MTTLYKKSICCSVCGDESEQTVIGSTSIFGSPDLDTRPPEIKRSTIHKWVQRCSVCGSCASSLSQASAHAQDVIQTSEYLTQLSDSNFPELANSFVCASMIHESNGEWSAAIWALIHAAWACDDARQSPQAVTCRKRAAAMLRKAQASGQTLSDQPGATTAILVDLLRRAGELDEAVKVIQESKATRTEDTIIRIMEYQTELIQANDIGCHTIAEALGEETNHGVNESKLAKAGTGNAQPARKHWWQFWQ